MEKLSKMKKNKDLFKNYKNKELIPIHSHSRNYEGSSSIRRKMIPDGKE